MATRSFTLAVIFSAGAFLSAAPLQPGVRVWLHAHNCYPEGGLWTDRLDRALGTTVPVAIEQDLVWVSGAETGTGTSVVSHGQPLTGHEPTLDEHFFSRIQPLMERALVEDRRNTWPLLVLHLDFKTNEQPHHQAVWALLERHRAWLTTAERVEDPRVMPLEPGPLMVLTENGAGQSATFHDRVRSGGRLLLFGTIAGPAAPQETSPEERMAWVANAAPEALIPQPASNYRRWVNFSWAAVERGGQAHAGDWSADDARRLQALVSRARSLSLWIRFYTLNGHAPADGQGWSEGYNFGSLDAVRTRWGAAIEAGVDFIATDQYELLARSLREAKGNEDR